MVYKSVYKSNTCTCCLVVHHCKFMYLAVIVIYTLCCSTLYDEGQSGVTSVGSFSDHTEGSTWVQIIYAMSHVTFYFFTISPCHFFVRPSVTLCSFYKRPCQISTTVKVAVSRVDFYPCGALYSQLCTQVVCYLQARTPDQWKDAEHEVKESPACRGGAGL